MRSPSITFKRRGALKQLCSIWIKVRPGKQESQLYLAQQLFRHGFCLSQITAAKQIIVIKDMVQVV